MSVLRRLWLWLSTIFTVAFLVVALTPAVNWYASRLAGPWRDPDGDILIVLAGADLDGGFPAENTILRCLYAARAYRAGHFRQIVVSGFRSGNHMRQLLAAEGIPAGRIAVEDAAKSTRENALNVTALVGKIDGTKVLLTSDYHMFRAARAFRKAGLRFLPRPIPDALKRGSSARKRWVVFQDETAESLKIVYYRLRGWI